MVTFNVGATGGTFTDTGTSEAGSVAAGPGNGNLSLSDALARANATGDTIVINLTSNIVLTGPSRRS